MFGSEILEVAIGLIFVFLLVSLICSAVREAFESWLKSRASFLEHGVRVLLDDVHGVGIARSVYSHPLISSLYAGRYEPRPDGRRPGMFTLGHDLPSYIPSRNFALALLDIAARGPVSAASAANPSSPVLSLPTVRANVINLENAYVQRVVLTAVDTASEDLDRAVANLAAWYDSAMDRVSGAYKRSTQKALFLIGLVTAVALNVNAVTIADYLYRNDDARTAVVARAEAAARDSSLLRGSDTTKFRAARAALDSLHLPIGWSAGWGAPRQQPDPTATGFWNNVLGPIVGFLFTALAATLGAPFWFDLLNKVTVIRSTVKPHEKSGEESSEDRQSPAARERAAAREVGAGAPPVGAAATPVGTGVPGTPATPLAHGTTDPALSPDDTVAEADFDGCNAVPETLTEDEDLPQAHGGVA